MVPASLVNLGLVPWGFAGEKSLAGPGETRTHLDILGKAAADPHLPCKMQGR